MSIGHNSDIHSERLRAFIKRIEELEEDKAAVAEDLKELYSEIKGTGYDTKAIRQIIKIRKMAADKRREQEELLEPYRSALGMED